MVQHSLNILLLREKESVKLYSTDPRAAEGEAFQDYLQK